MFIIVYISSAVELFSDQDLKEILRVSRVNNHSLDITGILLYRGGNFMQMLEGPKEAVLALVEKIKLDPRHRGFQVLLQKEETERQFSGWEMAFKKLDDQPAEDLSGHSDFLSQSFNDEAFKLTPSRALKLLLSFKQTMR